jgi:hypothetical protein
VVVTLLVHDLIAVEAYDGVWGYACLLHVPRNDLLDVLALVARIEFRRLLLLPRHSDYDSLEVTG